MLEEAFDCVVYGDGVRAFGAAVAQGEMGRSVLLVSPNFTFLRECSWSFLQSASGGESPEWLRFRALLAERGAWREDHVDGACAEVVAGEFARTLGIRFLLCATPCFWESAENLVAAVGFFTKSGARRVVGNRWLDASSGANLAKMVRPGLPEICPQTHEHAIFFKHPSERNEPSVLVECPLEGVTAARFGSTLWEDETSLRFQTKEPGALGRMLEVLAFARSSLPLEGAVVSHASVVSIPLGGKPVDAESLPGNLQVAGGNLGDVGGLFDLGVRAAHAGLEFCLSDSGDRHESPTEKSITCDVAVAGLGTGGAIAALAAAREGARVFAFDMMPLPGGIGTLGGIHLYYFGVQGGLQSEVDKRISEVMPLFGARKQIAGFHPLAKAVMLGSLLEGAGVTTSCETLLGNVSSPGNSLTPGRAEIFTPQHHLGLEAKAWVDATGDGDLAVRAGASWNSSSRLDGVSSAFSQASGRFSRRSGELFLRIVNFDAGYADATDAEDLTRARLLGLKHYESEVFTAGQHPTSIAPLVGTRQSRHIETEYVLTVADLVRRTRFEDSVGRTACHLDTHAVDFEFEPLEIAFWIWGCRNWRVRTACEIPYRSLLPKGLPNVFLGCRALGATPEAHQSFRMQRDMQRVGEVAGLAAAFVALFGMDSGAVPLSWLHKRLAATGALDEVEAGTFGYDVAQGDFVVPGESLDALLGATREGFGPHMYLLSLTGPTAKPGLLALLDADATASWRACVILSTLGASEAEPRLLDAIRTREVGFSDDDPRHPSKCQRLAPNWIAALTFLRPCASLISLALLEDLACETGLVHNARTAIALLCAAIADRCQPAAEDCERIRKILHLLGSTPAPNAVGSPQRNILGVSGLEGDLSIWYPEVVEDFRWQLDFALTKARLALGDNIQTATCQGYLSDPRAYVRSAFRRLLEARPVHSSQRKIQAHPPLVMA